MNEFSYDEVLEFLKRKTSGQQFAVLFSKFSSKKGGNNIMSPKELKKFYTNIQNEKISDSDFERLRQLDEILWDIVYPINADYSDVVTKELRWSIISDIFTSEKNNVLYEAIGRPALMYLMVNDINWARVVVWPVFTQYEFYTAESPINSETRYTDLDWQWSYDQLVESGKLDSLGSLATQEMIKEMK